MQMESERHARSKIIYCGCEGGGGGGETEKENYSVRSFPAFTHSPFESANMIMKTLHW